MVWLEQSCWQRQRAPLMRKLVRPSPGHTQVLLWPRAIPDPQSVPGPEYLKKTDAQELVAGDPYQYIGNVSRPTMTVYPPQGKNTGAAAIVFPGGGFANTCHRPGRHGNL